MKRGKRMIEALWIVYLMINVISFSLYGLDKRRAKQGLWRVRERTLVGITWMMGGVGAWLAMRLFRHKTKHKAFTFSAVAASVCQLALMVLATCRLLA